MDPSAGIKLTLGGARLRPTLRLLLLGTLGMARVCAMLLLSTSSSVFKSPPLLSAARMLAGSSTSGSSISGLFRPPAEPLRLPTMAMGERVIGTSTGAACGTCMRL